MQIHGGILQERDRPAARMTTAGRSLFYWLTRLCKRTPFCKKTPSVCKRTRFLPGGKGGRTLVDIPGRRVYSDPVIYFPTRKFAGKLQQDEGGRNAACHLHLELLQPSDRRLGVRLAHASPACHRPVLAAGERMPELMRQRLVDRVRSARRISAARE